MNTEENNQEVDTTTKNNEGDSSVDTKETEIITLKTQMEEMTSTIGSLKRELKDAKKSTPEKKDEKLDNNILLQKSFLRSAGITSQEEVDLALETSRKWGVEVDSLIDDDDFKVKLERMRTQKSNEKATSNIRGTASTSDAKNTSEYWLAKGTPPSREDVSDRKARVKIARAFMNAAKPKIKFYNE